MAEEGTRGPADDAGREAAAAEPQEQHFNSANMTGATIAKQFAVGRKLGHGAFGHVYAGRSLTLKDDLVAVKVEPRHVRPSLLSYESKIYRSLRGGPGIPLLRFNGSFKGRAVMVTDRLGPSLELLRTECGGQFTLKTTLLLADQILARLQFIHEQGFIHRDVKPDNFLIGRGNTRHVVYVIDFGLAKRFMRNDAHIPIRFGRGMTGTPRYASLHNHRGQEQSRRDDLISLAYMLIYFLRGKLPWQGIPAKSKKEKFAKIMDLKLQNTTEKLCEGLPGCFQRFLTYCYALRFTEAPNYDFLRALFFGARLKENINVASPMDLIEDIREQRRRHRERKAQGDGKGAAAAADKAKGAVVATKQKPEQAPAAPAKESAAAAAAAPAAGAAPAAQAAGAGAGAGGGEAEDAEAANPPMADAKGAREEDPAAAIEAPAPPSAAPVGGSAVVGADTPGETPVPLGGVDTPMLSTAVQGPHLRNGSARGAGSADAQDEPVAVAQAEAAGAAAEGAAAEQ